MAEEKTQRGEEEKEAKEKGRITTIRNLDEELYGKAVSIAKSLGKPVGEVFNEALRLLISTLEYGVTLPGYLAREAISKGKTAVESLVEARRAVVIGDLDELEVTRRDLEDLEGKVLFKNIKRLVISGDVDPKLFEEKVSGIVLCDTLVIPSSLPKLRVLAKAKMVKKVEMKD